ncbi:uncharacterized protein LOC110118697 isoform X1 [Ceratitis capitata]|uniref:uncharacterized protein LOC110118697 isoform X1 n=1 Tax=Ceratitis capitata TaxID=7213 RepID=UPI000A0F50D6|nr:uncharacterized protein LOC110118697 isoform X1 [Ceratitis capitata]
MPAMKKAAAVPRWYLYTYYFASLIGLAGFRVDFKERRIRRCTLMQIYACTLNTLTVCFLPLAYNTALKFLDHLNDNHLMKIVNSVNTVQIFFITSLGLIFRWKRENTIFEILTQILDLERRFFEKCVPQTVKAYCRQLHGNRLLWLKYFSVVTQIVYTLVNLVYFMPKISITWLLYSAHMFLLISMLLHMILHYFLAMWYLWKRFSWLNAQLRRIFNFLRLLEAHRLLGDGLASDAQRRLAGELLDVTRVHYQLTQFAEHLTKCFRLEIMGVLFSKIINNISIGYLCLKYNNNSYLKSLSVVFQMFSLMAIIITLSDSYLLDILCERVVGASHEAAEVLKRFDELFELDDAVEYACSIFSQHLRQHKLKINIFGMMNVNKRLSFLVFGGFVKNVLLLLQWDLAKQFEV